MIKRKILFGVYLFFILTLFGFASYIAISDYESPPLNWYIVKTIRPDGTVHSQEIIERYNKPKVSAQNGHMYVKLSDIVAPVGWLLTVEEANR